MSSTREDTLRRAGQSLDDGEFDSALGLLEPLLAADGDDVDALELRGLALGGLGEWERAEEAFDRLLELGVEDPALLLAAAEVKLSGFSDDPDTVEEALELVDEAFPTARKVEALHIQALLLRAMGLNAQGQPALALAAANDLLMIDPDDLSGRFERGHALFELGQLKDARTTFQRLSRDLPDDPEPFHLLGLIAERLGEDAAPLFTRATALDPQAYPPPTHLSPAEFDGALADAVASLPEHARAALANAVIDVRPIPDEAEVKDGVSPVVLGVFSGTPLTEVNPTDPATQQTARITVFQNNLERFARSREELVEEIRLTVLHEVGHLLGLSEDELYRRGLD